MEKLEQLVITGAAVAVALALLCLIIVIAIRIAKAGIPKVKLTTKKNLDGIVFGRFLWLYVCSPTDAEGHVGVFGGSGLGKTTGILIPTLKAWKGTSFVIDISGDIAAATKHLRKLVFAPYKKYCLPYNVFYSADVAGDLITQKEELNQITEAIMPERTFENDAAQFYYDSGKQILRAALLTYYYAGMDFQEICRKIVGTGVYELLNEIAIKNEPDAVIEIGSLRGIKESNLNSCKEALNKQIKPFINPRLKGLLRRPETEWDLYIAPPALEKTNIFFEVPDYYLSDMGPVMKLMVGQFFQYIAKKENYNDNNILFCLDEFASLGFLDIQGPLEKFRKKKVRIMILIQGRVRLDSVYDKLLRRAMMENIAYQAYLGVNDFLDQKELAEICGKEIKEDGRVDYRIEPARFGRMGKKLLLLNPGKEIWIRKIRVKRRKKNEQASR